MAVSKILAHLSLITLLLSLGNLFPIIHSINKENATTHNYKGFSLKLIHRDSPKSPFYQANLTKAMRRKEYIQMTKLRHNSLANSLSTNKTILNPNDDVEPIRPQMILQEFIYLVEIEIGTFSGNPDAITIYLGFDTASDLIWTQCEGCTNCFHQAYPYYPASSSHSFKVASCNQCANTAECVGNVCRETRPYGDGSVVKAVMAFESFTFRSQNDGLELDDILFGCGIDMKNFVQGDDANNLFSGYLGMGYGLYGFPEQATILVNGKFSYCLQPEQQGLPPMYVRFGDDATPPPAESYSTPMYQHGDKSYYYLNLQGIRVDDEDLNLPPGVFNIRGDGSGGCIIDTGTPTSRITSEAYGIFKDAVAQNIESANQNVERFQSRASGLDLCYKRTSEPETVNLPDITWVFENAADFVMTPDVTFDIFNEDGFHVFCLLFLESNPAENGGLTILGAEQQIDHRIIHDIVGGQLHFGPEDCSNGA